jgi:hypothetical protein
MNTDFLQHINPATAVLVAVGLCALCLILPVIFTGINIVTSIIGIFTHLLGTLTHIVSGGPVAWFGCLVAIGACGFILMMAWLLASAPASCAAHPTNFCSLLGY